MAKSTFVTESKKEDCFRASWENGKITLIVLVSSGYQDKFIFSGQVVYTDGSKEHLTIGHHSESWSTSYFIPFNGSVTIEG